MNATHLSRIAIILFLVFGMAASAHSEDPLQQIKETTDKLLSVLTNPALKGPAKGNERKELIFKTADERFDWEEMARRSLARHWTQRTPEEKREFVRLFRELLGRTYMDKIEGYKGEKIVYVGENIEGDYGVVKVKVVTSKSQEIPLEYRLLKKGDNWMTYDVSIEGVSLVNNYRAQFNSIILDSSYRNLIEKMKAKVNEK